MNLVANAFLTSRTGSENWTRLMARKLDADVFSLEGENTFDSTKQYNLALINHHLCLERLKHLECNKIYTSHGIHPLEIPVKGADLYVSVSEEVQENLLKHGFESVVIRNPIDTERFKPQSEVNEELTNVLFISNYAGKAERVIKEACQGLNFKRIGASNSVEEVEDYIDWADLVISLGRGAMESMACNRNVIVYDYNGGDGFIDELNVHELRKRNFSGRTHRYDFSPEELRREFTKYDPKLTMRDYILANNDSNLIVNKYLYENNRIKR